MQNFTFGRIYVNRIHFIVALLLEMMTASGFPVIIVASVKLQGSNMYVNNSGPQICYHMLTVWL